MSKPSRYELVRTIASGGMAHVYEAIAHGDGGFTRKVAIKRILPEFADVKAMRTMFLDEARIASRLHHGNIVQVLDYGLLDGAELLVLEHVDGLDASRALERAEERGDAFPEGLALHVTSEIAHALRHAHELTDDEGELSPVIHRDVSPHNVLLGWGGEVKLTDFGIALAAGRRSKTRTGLVKGKPAYMAPEQLRGLALSGAADVFGLGASLRTLLLGEVEELDASAFPGLSPECADLLRACLDPDPTKRPTAGEVAQRAGNLARTRLNRDGRGALQDWLSDLRRSPKKTHALDDVMGMALVRTEEAHGFTVSKDSPRAGALLDAAAAPTHAADDTDVQLPLKSNRLWLVGLGGAAVLLIGAGLFTAQLAEPTETVESSTALSNTVDPNTALDSANETEPEQPPDPAPTADPGRLPQAPVVRPTKMRPPPATDPAPPLMTPDPPLPLMTPDPVIQDPPGVVEGWIRIGRSTAAQERVLIDGRPRGFTPYSGKLPVGSHRIQIADAESGAVLADRSISVEERHTRASPLVVRP